MLALKSRQLMRLKTRMEKTRNSRRMTLEKTMASWTDRLCSRQGRWWMMNPPHSSSPASQWQQTWCLDGGPRRNLVERPFRYTTISRSLMLNVENSQIFWDRGYLTPTKFTKHTQTKRTSLVDNLTRSSFRRSLLTWTRKGRRSPELLSALTRRWRMRTS